VKRIFIPTKTGSDWQGLLAKPKLHWKKGASAMTAAAAWEDAGDALPRRLRLRLTHRVMNLCRISNFLPRFPNGK
jgi:hypothetical protein